MKTPEEYLNEWFVRANLCNTEESFYKELIKQVQIDAWNEALNKAAESVKMTGIAYGKDTCISDYEVDLDSILKLKL